MSSNPPKFDAYADSYESLHSASVKSSGEGPAYFAEYKVARMLREGLGPDARVLDYGCGIGNVLAPLSGAFREVHGFDPSSESLRMAAARAPKAVLHQNIGGAPDAFFDAVVLSGVLHHVAPDERAGTIQLAASKLGPHGKLFIFEHNPFNPLTRHVVATCAFDDDAVLLWPWQARAALNRAHLAEVRLDYIVFFPRRLAFLRSFEPLLHWLPLGAQVMVVGTRSA